MKTDPYKRLAAELYGVDYEAVTPAQRRGAKQAAYGYVYGARGYAPVSWTPQAKEALKALQPA